MKQVTILGGEPLLNFDLIKRVLLETNYIVSISTGLFVKDKLFDRFMEIGTAHNERMSIQCSIDPTNKYRPGTNGGRAIYDRTERILEEFISTQLRCTICTGDIDYRKLRNGYEKKLNKEISTTFEIVNTPDLWPAKSEWYHLLGMLVTDAHEYLDGERTELPLSAAEVADNLLKQWNEGHSNFYVALGCSMYSGESPVLTPDTVINKEFQRCTQPQDSSAINRPFTLPEQCSQCEILRYCGVSCPTEAAVPSFCATQLLKHLASMYVFLWRNEKWN
jgi:radical SAM protein with 4Fe4S-binding SPASM domain